MRRDLTPEPEDPVSTEPDLQPASVFAGRYRIDFLLAAGGMGKVYKAYDLVLNRFVALKFVRTSDPELERRLLLEAQAQAKVEHDCICKVFDFGRKDGRLFIAMHFVEGDAFNSAQSWDLIRKVSLMKSIAEAMHAAHEAGLIHRDIKPSNILLEHLGNGECRPCILDFGLVRDTTRADQSRTGTVHGTPRTICLRSKPSDKSTKSIVEAMFTV